jgi:hypothetical protein
MPNTKRGSGTVIHKTGDSRVTRIVAALIFALLSLIILMRIYDSLAFIGRRVLPWHFQLSAVITGSLALITLGLGLFVFKRIRSTMLFAFGLLLIWTLALLAFIVMNYDAAVINVLYAVIPGLAILYAVWQLYAPDFTWVTAICEIGLLYCWLFPTLYERVGRDRAVSAAAAVALAVLSGLFIVFLWSLQRGKMKHIPHLRKKLFFPPVYAASGLLFAVTASSLLINPVIAMYAGFVFIAVFFVSAVVYTVRLM